MAAIFWVVNSFGTILIMTNFSSGSSIIIGMTEHSVETEARTVIRKSESMAARLMMTRKSGEAVTSYLRTYVKPLEVDQGSGLEVLVVQDTGLTDGRPSERFSVGVSLKSDYWQDMVNLETLAGQWGSLVINRGYGFAKSSLKTQGYGQIYDAVRKLEEEGFF